REKPRLAAQGLQHRARHDMGVGIDDHGAPPRLYSARLRRRRAYRNGHPKAPGPARQGRRTAVWACARAAGAAMREVFAAPERAGFAGAACVRFGAGWLGFAAACVGRAVGCGFGAGFAAAVDGALAAAAAVAAAAASALAARPA